MQRPIIHVREDSTYLLFSRSAKSFFTVKSMNFLKYVFGSRFMNKFELSKSYVFIILLFLLVHYFTFKRLLTSSFYVEFKTIINNNESALDWALSLSRATIQIKYGACSSQPSSESIYLICRVSWWAIIFSVILVCTIVMVLVQFISCLTISSKWLILNIVYSSPVNSLVIVRLTPSRIIFVKPNSHSKVTIALIVRVSNSSTSMSEAWHLTPLQPLRLLCNLLLLVWCPFRPAL